MKLNKKLELGIKAVKALKTRTTPTRTADIAGEVGTTVSFLEQIMRYLRKGGIVTVKRGPGGGYSLDPSKTVTAYDVALAVGRFSEPEDTSYTGPTGDLRQSIVTAFQNTTI